MPFNLELEEVRGTGDARVVVANCHFARTCRFRLRSLNYFRNQLAQVGFDAGLVLRRRWHDPRRSDQSPLVGLVGMKKRAAWRLRNRTPDSSTWLERGRGRHRWLVTIDDPQ